MLDVQPCVLKHPAKWCNMTTTFQVQDHLPHHLYGGEKINGGGEHFPLQTTALSFAQGRCAGWQAPTEQSPLPQQVDLPVSNPEPSEGWQAGLPPPKLVWVEDYHKPETQPSDVLYTGKTAVETPKTESAAEEKVADTTAQPLPTQSRPVYTIYRAVWGSSYYYRRQRNGYALHVPSHGKAETF